MENKKIIIITGIVLLIVIAAALLLRSSRQPAEYEYYTEEPETWVEGQRFTEPPNDVRINVFKATGGESTFSINKQDFPGEDKAFFVQGLYKGKYFGTVYYDNETKEKIIEISQSLDPDDGAADIFILAKSDGPGFVFYIFVDEDWRNSVSFTNIIYGMDFNNDATLIEREFNFTELSFFFKQKTAYEMDG